MELWSKDYVDEFHVIGSSEMSELWYEDDRGRGSGLPFISLSPILRDLVTDLGLPYPRVY